MVSPRSVHLLTHEFYPRRGGIATYTQGLAEAAVRAGFEVHVWAPQHPLLAERATPYTVHALPLPGREDWSDRVKLSQALQAGGVDWASVQVCLVDPGPLRTWLYAPWLKLPQPARLSIVVHGSELGRIQRFPHRRVLFQQLVKRSARIGVVSSFVGKALRQTAKPLPGQVVRVPGAPLPQWFATPPARVEGAARLRLLTVARLHRRKGQHRVMEALGLLPVELRRRWEYHLVGPAKDMRYRAELEELARQHGLRVHFAGAVADEALPAQYAAADLFVLPSEVHGASVEGLGLALLEAAAAGVPVVATRTGGIPEAVDHQGNGLLVPAGSLTALAAALERLTHDADLRQRLGAAGPAWVQQHFNWDRNVQALFGDEIPPECNFSPAPVSN